MAPRNNTNTIASGENSQAAGGNITNTTNNIVATSPMIIFDPQRLADIINALNSCMLENEADPINDFALPGIETKNELNGISRNFFRECIEENYEYFTAIDGFFKDPSNKGYKDKFKHILTEVKAKIIARQSEGESMESIIATLFDYAKIGDNIKLFNDNSYLADILASYMYANCHIGRKA